MKIAVSSSGPSLDDPIEARFGRCPYFVLVDTDTLDFESIPNPNVTLGGGAGIQSAQLMAEKGVSVVLTGNCGPNVFQVFGAAGIQVFTGVDGVVRNAVEKFKSGKMAKVSSPNVDAHFGMGGGMGRGMGTGRGMGMGGGGRGRGMGRGTGGGTGMGRGTGMMASGGGMTPPAAEAGSPSIRPGGTREEEMALLRESAENLRRQLENIESRLKEITENQ